jgi:hypothetical protein
VEQKASARFARFILSSKSHSGQKNEPLCILLALGFYVSYNSLNINSDTISVRHRGVRRVVSVSVTIYFVNIYSTKRFGLCFQFCRVQNLVSDTEGV